MAEQDKNVKIIDLYKVWKAIWAKRKLFFIAWPIVFVLSCLWILPQPRYYVASLSLAPESAGENVGGGLSSIASSFGINLGSMQNNDAIYPTLYPDLFTSPEFTVSLLDIQVTTEDGELTTDYYDYLKNHQKKNWLTRPFALAVNWVKSQFEEEEKVQGGGAPGKINPFRMSKKDEMIVRAVQNSIQCSVDKKTNVTTISVQDQDPLICASLADSVKQRLQSFIVKYRTSKARLDLAYYQHLADSAQIEYRKSVSAYSRFCDTHQNVILQSYISQRDELEASMEMKQNSYRAMQTQVEAMQAKVQESTPAFTTLVSPTVPIKPDGPKRMIFVATMLLLSTFVIALYAAKDVILKK